MQIADERVHRLLTYIEAAERQGEPVTREQAVAYDQALEASHPFSAKWAAAVGLIAGGALPSPMSILARTEWVWRNPKERLVVSPLGRAMLRELDAIARRAALEPSSAIVLKAGDPFALSELVAEIGELGPAALLDPWLDVQALRTIAESAPEIRRVLTRSTPEKRLRALRHAASAAPAIEIRVRDEELHERGVIPDAGGYWLLSNSINGIGRTTATVAQLPESVAGTLRDEFERLWATADPVVADSDAAEAADAGEQPPKRASRPRRAPAK